MNVHVKLLPGGTDAGQVFDMARPVVFELGVGVGVGVRALVGVAVGVRVGVAVGALVAVLAGVTVAVAGIVGVGVATALMAIVALPLLFERTGSLSFAITPATTFNGTACSGTTVIATSETPVAGQITVVDVSPAPPPAVQPIVEPEALHVTAG